MSAAVRIVPRSVWGARAPTKPATPAQHGFWAGLAVHHSGSPEDRQQDHKRCAPRVQAIQRYHQAHQGWSDIAYHWVACEHGALFLGRGIGVRSAANGSDWANSRYPAVCALGVWQDGSLPPLLLAALTAARHELLRVAPGALGVRPHLHFTSTACPGPLLTVWASTEHGHRPKG